MPLLVCLQKKKTAIIVLSGVLSRSFSLGAVTVTVELITFGEDKLSFFFFPTFVGFVLESASLGRDHQLRFLLLSFNPIHFSTFRRGVFSFQEGLHCVRVQVIFSSLPLFFRTLGRSPSPLP